MPLSVPAVFFIPAQGVDLLHFSLGQLEVVEFSILLDMVGIAGAGDDHHALLRVPAEDDLGRGHAVGLGDGGDCLIPSSSAVCPRPSSGYHPWTTMPVSWM